MTEKVIELYIDFETYSSGGKGSGRVPSLTGGGMTSRKNFAKARYATHTVSGYDYQEEKAKEMLENISETHGIKLIIFNTSKKSDRKQAKKKGIKTTPSVVIGDKIFDKDINEASILQELGFDVEKIERKNFVCPKCNSPNIKVCRDKSGQCNDCNLPFMNAKQI